MSFDDDLKLGQFVEKEVALLLSSVPHLIDLRLNFDGRYDIYAKIEVKYQPKAHSAFFIETSFKGKPSGITTTDAHQWVLVSEDEYYICPVETIKDLSDNKASSEYANTLGYVIYKDKLKQQEDVTVIDRK